ncbi:hypothetical protein HK405_000187, partial [Cladochytrium tenue]
VIMGVVTGLLPSVLLSVLMSLVPVVIRLCARLAGEPSLSRVELFTQSAYFAFQVIQVFLVTTLSSAATAVAKQIVDNPASATTILSNNLPKASNFYISYFIVQGLTVASGVISQVVGFAIFTLTYKFLASTPRALYKKWANLSAISWGNTMPVYANIAVIALAYAAIAPLVLGFAAVAVALFYLAWRYNVLFVSDTPIDTRGLIYPRALKQLLVGVYLGEVCLIGLFGASVAPGPLVLTIILLVVTVLVHRALSEALDPLLVNLPQTSLVSASAAADGGDDSTPFLLADLQQPDDPEAAAALPPPREKKEPTAASTSLGFLGQEPNAAALRALLLPAASSTGGGGNDDDDAGDDPEAAYLPPSARAPAPRLWLPSDGDHGLAAAEAAESGRILQLPAVVVVGAGCVMDDRGRLVWDRDLEKAPLADA